MKIAYRAVVKFATSVSTSKPRTSTKYNGAQLAPLDSIVCIIPIVIEHNHTEGRRSAWNTVKVGFTSFPDSTRGRRNGRNTENINRINTTIPKLK